MRIGFGYDVHRLVPKRRLIIGGVEIPSEKGLLGHSDADVLLHAIADAVLGAAALGDVGAHFPDTDERWRGANSRALLTTVRELIGREGFHVGNVDSTVVLEKPRLRPYVDEMRRVISECLAIDITDVSVKATTHEEMDAIGSGKGAAAYAVCTIVRRRDGVKDIERKA